MCHIRIGSVSTHPQSMTLEIVYFRGWFRDAGRFANERGSEAAREFAERLERAYRDASHEGRICADVTPLLQWLRSKGN